MPHTTDEQSAAILWSVGNFQLCSNGAHLYHHIGVLLVIEQAGNLAANQNGVDVLQKHLIGDLRVAQHKYRRPPFHPSLDDYPLQIILEVAQCIVVYHLRGFHIVSHYAAAEPGQ